MTQLISILQMRGRVLTIPGHSTGRSDHYGCICNDRPSRDQFFSGRNISFAHPLQRVLLVGNTISDFARVVLHMDLAKLLGNRLLDRPSKLHNMCLLRGY
jgi:hypothetical protein